jgi:hypothetical protein
MEMDYIYIPLGMLIPVIALFKRELLVQRESFMIILLVTIILFVAGLGLHFAVGDKDSSCGALLAPLFSLCLYRCCRRLFLRQCEHEPRDTYLNWETGLAADRIFNIVFFGGSFLLFVLTTLGMIKLARTGW